MSMAIERLTECIRRAVQHAQFRNFYRDRFDSHCTAPGFLDTRLSYAAWRGSYCSRASSGVRYASFSRRQHWL